MKIIFLFEKKASGGPEAFFMIIELF